MNYVYDPVHGIIPLNCALTLVKEENPILNEWVELDERRHPEFQAKELLAKSKEALKQQRT